MRDLLLDLLHGALIVANFIGKDAPHGLVTGQDMLHHLVLQQRQVQQVFAEAPSIAGFDHAGTPRTFESDGNAARASVALGNPRCASRRPSMALLMKSLKGPLGRRWRAASWAAAKVSGDGSRVGGSPTGP